MAGNLDVDLRSVRKAFRQMERAGANPRKIWRAVRKPLRDDQKEHMAAEEDHKGSPWKPLAPSTRERRLSKGGRAGKFTKRGTLKKRAARSLDRILSKKLLSGAKVKIERHAISITSKVPWAGVHQHGGTVGRGSRIPARPFMYVSDELMARAIKLLQEEIAAAFSKGG